MIAARFIKVSFSCIFWGQVESGNCSEDRMDMGSFTPIATPATWMLSGEYDLYM